ncbi:MAG: hypothetical protein JW779_13130 [Candidatus Thorarchaeota archaeon]|nr:hypothetical protein [Candidatus Thorarchaeota archaeon]
MKHARLLSSIVLVMFLAGLLAIPVEISTDSARPLETTPTLNNDNAGIRTSAIPADREIRIALFDQQDTTLPSYDDSDSILSNNYEELETLLVNAGFSVTRLTLNDIQEYELLTAEFDIFLLADSLPNSNISNHIKSFWLGGGAILGLDSAAVYLNYAGILPRESSGSSGFETYWSYQLMDVCNISERHPITKSYSIGDELTNYLGNWTAYNWTTLQSTSIADTLTRLAVDESSVNQVHAIGHDPVDMGGRIVHLGTPITPLGESWNQLIIDAIYWLCPQPKARIVFDYTHNPYYTIDPWDNTPGAFTGYYEIWRNDLVMRGYLVDKLFPSPEGTLTVQRLSPYHLLVEVLPDENFAFNFTSAEVAAVADWVNSGGGLLVLSDNWSGSLITPNQMLNYLLSPYNIEIFQYVYAGAIVDVYDQEFHPTTEGCTQLYMRYTGFINYTLTGFPIWTQDGNTYVAGDTYGEGRIILSSDLNYLADNYIMNQDNRDFGINMVNWLSAGAARVLYYTTEPESINYYRSPGANALRDLGLNYYLTYIDDFMNLSLNSYDWDLVVLDGPYYTMYTYYDDMLEYVLSGGKLIMSEYFAASFSDHPLWAALGVKILETIGDNRTLSIWTPDHPIFNIPNDYGCSEFLSTVDFGAEGTLMEPYANATALVGNSTVPTTNQSVIVLRNDHKTIMNAFLIDQFQGDLDDSTYMDAYELWQNEITYVMFYDDAPTIDNPSDLVMEAGSTGNVVTWSPSSSRPFWYEIMIGSSVIRAGRWLGSAVAFSADDLEYRVNPYEIVISLWDAFRYSISDVVLVTVEDTTAPDFTLVADDLTYVVGTTGHVLIWETSEVNPSFFDIYLDAELTLDDELWNGTHVVYPVDGLAIGSYNITVVIVDMANNFASDTVSVTVIDSMSPLIVVVAVIGLAAVVIVIVLVIMKRKKS